MERKVRIAKPSKEELGLSPYQMFCLKVLGKYTAKKKYPELEKNLLKSHTKMRPEEYVAFAIFTSILSAIFGIFIVFFLFFLFLPLAKISLPIIFQIIFYFLPILFGIVSFFVLIQLPSSSAKERGKDVDRKLPYAMNFISAMASANVNVDVIFRELARERIYGEVSKEASWIIRDVDILGKDIITSLRTAIDRSPSIMFQDFLQGVITTTISGGSLKSYFMLKAEEYMKQHKMAQKKFHETLGILAESFVAVVVAAPLFLIVIISLMALVGKDPKNSIMFLYIIIFLMVPLSQFGFIFVIKTMSPEV